MSENLGCKQWKPTLVNFTGKIVYWKGTEFPTESTGRAEAGTKDGKGLFKPISGTVSLGCCLSHHCH